jgi:hypothetical protein
LEKRAAIRVILINSYNWYYKMFSAKKTRRIYQSPHTKVAEVDLEGNLLIPGSQTLNVQWDESKNVNISGEKTLSDGNALYFE